LRGEVFVDLGAYVRTNGLIAPRILAQCFTGPYRVPNVRITSTALLTNKTPSGTYRAPGRYEGSVFCAAHRAGGPRPGDRQRRDASASAR
jgi:carbon-monoxide dehydrogenase large subunit